jgi:trans-aconitate methyltransferase
LHQGSAAKFVLKILEDFAMLDNQWNTSLYENKHSFVWQYGEDVLKLLNPQLGERILDLGCGTGQLAAKIATMAQAEVVGLDRSPSMIETASHHYPHLSFGVADARDFQVDRPFDAIFSNAALHWIPDADAVIRSAYRALKPNGRFVAEFGGKGNIHAIVTALEESLELLNMAVQPHAPQHAWYFPSIGDYAARLEHQGFDVVYAVLFDRPTPLEDGERGLANWLMMFASRFLEHLSAKQQAQVMQTVEHRLRPMLYRNGTWFADYRRIRVMGVKRDSEGSTNAALM